MKESFQQLSNKNNRSFVHESREKIELNETKMIMGYFSIAVCLEQH